MSYLEFAADALPKPQIQSIPTGRPMEFEIRDCVRVKPFDDRGGTTPVMAIGGILLDRETQDTYSYAKACSLSLAPNAVIWKILSAMSNKKLTPSNLNGAKGFDFDKLLGRHIVLYFALDKMRNKPVPITYNYINKDKWTNMVDIHYERPVWVTNNLYDDGQPEFTGSIDDALDNVDMGENDDDAMKSKEKPQKSEPKKEKEKKQNKEVKPDKPIEPVEDSIQDAIEIGDIEGIDSDPLGLDNEDQVSLPGSDYDDDDDDSDSPDFTIE